MYVRESTSLPVFPWGSSRPEAGASARESRTMRPIRGEPVEVWLRHSRPARFVWRGRLYVVLFVLDRRGGVPQPPGDGGDAPLSPEYWLVEATAQQGTAATTFELRHDSATGRWTLSRN
jgi:hypothetical protein